MKTTEKFIDEIFDFEGLWGMPSKCGLKIIEKDDQKVVIVTELYQNNPGTSVTQAAALLAKQICTRCSILPQQLTYIEHNPGMNSKLSFYDEDFFLVEFDITDNNFSLPKWHRLTVEQIKDFVG